MVKPIAFSFSAKPTIFESIRVQVPIRIHPLWVNVSWNSYSHSIAHINIAKALAPLNDPIMAEFVTLWEEINVLADSSPGFIWRLDIPEGDPTYVRPYEDQRILINISVWATVHDFASFVFAGDHLQVMKRRRQWFERFEGPNQALWWVPQGYIPTAQEGKQRLDHLCEHGPTQYAFTLKEVFPTPDEGAMSEA
jgi:hypothetical protein